jgi:thiamine transport system substrate-binding protein
MRWRPVVVVVALLVVLSSCSGGDGAGTSTSASEEPVTITLLTHDSFLLSDGTLEAFTAETGIGVELLAGGDAGVAVNQAIVTRDDPIADVLFGVDNTLLTRALDADLFLPYQSPALDGVPAELRLDAEHRVTPIDYGDVCVNYDVAALAASGVEPPDTLDDLVDPAYRGMLVVQDPATSSPGLAFLLATIARYGEGGWQEWWSGLAANDVLVTSGWEEAYNGAFTAASETGDRTLVVSYASSPPAEVYFAETPPAEAPTGSMTDGCFRQVEFAGILAGTDHETEARQLIDFMLSAAFQEDIPLNMFVFPAVEGTPLPDVFVEHAAVVEEPLGLPPGDIEANRESWIQEWTDLLR